jgi:hypothetical protein
MKIYLGKYPTDYISSKIYYNYMNKKYDHLWDKSNTPYEKFLEKLENTLQWIYNRTINPLIRNRKRKISIRIDEYDTWSMDHTLSMIILPMLKQLKETKHGSPFVDDKDVPKHLRSTAAPPKENEWDTDENHHKRWEWVLDEMIHAFECDLDDDWDKQFHSGNFDIEWVPTEDGKFYQAKDGPNHTHKFDKKGYKKAMDRRRNGHILFGKYYMGLWD